MHYNPRYKQKKMLDYKYPDKDLFETWVLRVNILLYVRSRPAEQHSLLVPLLETHYIKGADAQCPYYMYLYWHGRVVSHRDSLLETGHFRFLLSWVRDFCSTTSCSKEKLGSFQ